MQLCSSDQDFLDSALSELCQAGLPPKTSRSIREWALRHYNETELRDVRGLLLLVIYFSHHLGRFQSESLDSKIVGILTVFSELCMPIEKPQQISEEKRGEVYREYVGRLNRALSQMRDVLEKVHATVGEDTSPQLQSTPAASTMQPDDLRQKIREIMASPTLSPTEKQQQVQVLYSPSVMPKSPQKSAASPPPQSTWEVPKNYQLMRRIQMGETTLMTPRTYQHAIRLTRTPTLPQSNLYATSAGQFMIPPILFHILISVIVDRTALDEEKRADSRMVTRDAISAALDEYKAGTDVAKAFPEPVLEAATTRLFSALMHSATIINPWLLSSDAQLAMAGEDKYDPRSEISRELSEWGITEWTQRGTQMPEWFEDILMEADGNTQREAVKQRDSGLLIPVTISYYLEEGVGCQHYLRSALLVCPKCDEVHVCRVCHDLEHEGDHDLPRFDVTEVVCALCGKRQPWAHSCSNPDCPSGGKPFATYICDVCHFLDSYPGKHIYHCSQCRSPESPYGICRVGKKEGMEHCPRCNICWQRGIPHNCVPISGDTQCPLCFQSLFTSRARVSAMPCGHLIHIACWEGILNTDRPVCPVCSKLALIGHQKEQWENAMEMWINNQPTPKEYQSHMEHLACNECQFQFSAPLSFTAYKCPSCGSHNCDCIV